jgi:CDP-diacylglycerol--glycerol-3-phosphate 3-phosphatidyltransferase
VILLSTLAEFAGVLGPTVGASRRYDGPLGKSDRALVFGALGIWIALGGALPGWLFWLMPLLGLFLLVTTANRVRAGLAEAKRGRAV